MSELIWNQLHPDRYVNQALKQTPGLDDYESVLFTHQALLRGQVVSNRCRITIRLKVTIKDQKIVSIEIIKHNTWKGEKAEQIISNRIIEKQSTNVDVVTGATNSRY
jgi:hypothetical protein